MTEDAGQMAEDEFMKLKSVPLIAVHFVVPTVVRSQDVVAARCIGPDNWQIDYA
jgi:hypothetical protein